MTTEYISQLTPEQKNALIAKACGWEARHIEDRCDGVNRTRCAACGAYGHSNCYGNGTGPLQFTCADMPCCEKAVPPPYAWSLDAMHEAEKVLSLEQQQVYVKALLYAFDPNEHGQYDFDKGTSTFEKPIFFQGDYTELPTEKTFEALIRATADQRADAFLLTV